MAGDYTGSDKNTRRQNNFIVLGIESTPISNMSKTCQMCMPVNVRRRYVGCCVRVSMCACVCLSSCVFSVLCFWAQVFDWFERSFFSNAYLCYLLQTTLWSLLFHNWLPGGFFKSAPAFCSMWHSSMPMVIWGNKNVQTFKFNHRMFTFVSILVGHPTKWFPCSSNFSLVPSGGNKMETYKIQLSHDRLAINIRNAVIGNNYSHIRIFRIHPNISWFI